MRLIQIEEGGHRLSMTEVNDRDVPKYAILSHTWGDEEITFEKMRRNQEKDSEGYRKIEGCCRIAAAGYQYVWVDTCCIDKTSSAELSEAINSMYRWYEEADVCYAYLADVPNVRLTESRWFTRGWTLQELIAPKEVIFFDKEWNILGTRDSLQNEISERTKIPLGILDGSQSLETMSVAQRMSWAAERNSSRIEDEAYCLMGIFGINMPLLYGEGHKAFIRLQEEIMNISDDHTIFAWKDMDDSENDGGLLASSPAAFAESHDIIVKSGPSFSNKAPWRLDNKGLHLELYTMAVGSDGLVLAVLPCTEVGMEDDWMGVYLRDRTFTLENFERVCKSELVPVDLRLFRPAQYPSRMLCVERQRLSTIKKNTNKKNKHDCPSNLEQATGLSLFITPDDPTQIQQDPTFTEAGTVIPPLTQAAIEGDLERTWSLLSLPRIRPDQPDANGRTALSYAAEYGHIEVVWLLLTRSDVEPFSGDARGITPVIYAAVNGHSKVVEVFLSRKNSQNDIRDAHGRTLLSYAAEGGHEAVVKMLASRSDFDPELEDASGRTPLSWTSQCGHDKIVELLTDHGADVNVPDVDEKPPLWHAVSNGRVKTMHKLIERGASTQNTLFTLPMDSDIREEIICTLAPYDAFFDPNDVAGSGILIWAAENQYQSLFDTLLFYVADVDKPDALGRTILSWSLETETTDIFDQIVAHGLDLNAACMCRPGPADSNTVIRETPLAWAARTKRYELFRKLVTLGVDLNPEDDFLPRITTPLDWALKEGDKSLFELLLDHGADIHAQDTYGCPLFRSVALDPERGDFIQIFLNHGADPNVSDELPPLFAAAYGRNMDAMRLLLERGANPNAWNTDPEPLIHFAAKQELHDMVSLLIDYKVDVNACNRDGTSPLAAAIGNGDIEMAKLLLSHGASPNTKDSDGTTPLIDALRNRRSKLVTLLLDHGADANVRDGYGTPAVVDAMDWSGKMAKLLIAHGADPHAKDSRDGRSASKYA
ncbi:ankyrin repeat-containing domain protein [Aspergillus ambiguus]|uniref:ankyrin repeat-containing domain protein n=1 Tax=Aspergillus ambiguus TaxID=176160 RepID=UPI003CCE3038